MNGPEILHLIRHELQHAVGRRGKPPTVDRWTPRRGWR